jgi:hypothetical protein
MIAKIIAYHPERLRSREITDQGNYQVLRMQRADTVVIFPRCEKAWREVPA